MIFYEWASYSVKAPSFFFQQLEDFIFPAVMYNRMMEAFIFQHSETRKGEMGRGD